MADPVDAPVEELERCYRHPNEETRVHCTRCGRPICPACMNPAPVGHHCPTCVAEARRDARVPVGRRARGAVTRMGRPGAISTVLLGAIVAMFLVEVVASGGSALGGEVDVRTLLNLGGLSPFAVASGQWWRLFTAIFLHAGLWHIAFNAWALYLLGGLIETTFGRLRFVAIFFVTGFLGSVASYMFSAPEIVGVGASGAVFGLLGAWLAFNWRRRELALASANLRWVWTILAINLVFGFAVKGIDNWAHIGGFVSGIAAGTFAEGFGRRETRTIVTVVGLVALVILGVVLVSVRTHQLTG